MRRIIVGLNALSIAAVLLGSCLPAALASHKKHSGAVTYKAHCGMVYSAAEAKKNHYICPMDHKPLMKMAAGASHKHGARGSMHGMKM